MADDRHDVAFLVGAIIGGVAGGAAMLFAAPQSGAATRSDLRSQVAALTGRTASLTDQAREQVRGQIAGVQQTAAPLIARVRSDPESDASHESDPAIVIERERGVTTETTNPPAATETVGFRSATDLRPTVGSRDSVAPAAPSSDSEDDTPTIAAGTDFPAVKR